MCEQIPVGLSPPAAGAPVDPPAGLPGAPAAGATDGAPAKAPDKAPVAPDAGGASAGPNWLYWLTTVVTILLVVVFVVTSYFQLQRLHTAMADRAWTEPTVDALTLADGEASPEYRLAAYSWRSLVMLEVYGIERRYHQANILLMSRVWIQYLGFIVGMILALMGGAFIIGRLREPEMRVAAAMGKDRSFSVVAASPGMFLALLGVSLMLVTIIVNHRIEVSDQPMYVIYGDLPGVKPSLVISGTTSITTDAPALDSLPETGPAANQLNQSSAQSADDLPHVGAGGADR